jgi:signal recognition particle subunit SRP54
VFDRLSERLGAIFSRLSGRGRISERDFDDAMREIRVALLEADVSLPAAKAFAQRVRERALGAEVLASLTPSQTIVKIVHDELVELLGGADDRSRAAMRLRFADAPPTVILLAGLQGSGKTTQAAKLALRLKEQGRRSLLVAADIHRPAAIAQLQSLGERIGVPVFERGTADAVRTARAGVDEARRLGIPVVIVDTAGRMQVDEEMMDEIAAVARAIEPHEVLFVADAMTGREAGSVARAFHERLRLTGVILTKLDGDARGGAALSIFHETGAPIKFIGTGEKLDAFEPFHPERIASRILGMGDVLTLVERTQKLYSEEQAKALEAKLLRNRFTLDDFLEQLRQVRKMGSMTDLLRMIPGLSGALPKGFEIPERELTKVEAIICSMTKDERRDPSILDGSRRKRIARGSGTHVSDVNRLVRQFEQSKKLMKQFGGKRRGRLPIGSFT